MSDTSDANPLLIDMRPRILFVDDSKVVRSAAVHMLGDDFDLALAEDGQKAWDMIVADNTIKLVFTDLVMPELDGFEVLNLVRASTDERIRKLPIIVLTAADDSSGSKEKAYQMGATDFITKPFDAAKIKAGAEAHLSHLNTLNAARETSETSNQSPLGKTSMPATPNGV